ncbi:MAG: spore maturation protein A [Candidatus Improbicoccus pseudotrichonymphae]|uniref:Spore maturation protein A n=1 Tax=Candidatus Improbicoccus pseudotrichonymphae TaxID=3033792 RepID=A0AA48I4G2_9FIRM|nr:MAG: spore maturation protein A [Candidatus Improbicoccus pseudotrichonymphae]
MLNYVWTFMIIISFICSAVNGKMGDLTCCVIDGASDAIKVSIVMLGSMAFWSGIMQIAKDCGIVKLISSLIYPILKFLFPKYSKEEKISQPLCMNIVSNMLGLSNAATPFGLTAIREMQNINKTPDTATNEMITFIILNTSCFQLIPATLAALRKNYGSKNPFDILIPLWIASLTALLFGIFLSKIFSYRRKNRQKNKAEFFKKREIKWG